MFRIIKICYILILIIAIYWGMSSYTILYKESIKISSPIHYFNKTYDYSQIKSIDVGVSSAGGGYNPYYKITINNKTVDLFGGSISDKVSVPSEEILINLDINLKELGIPKAIDKRNLEKF